MILETSIRAVGKLHRDFLIVFIYFGRKRASVNLAGQYGEIHLTGRKRKMVMLGNKA